MAPLLEEDFCYELADQAAEQSCYGCFTPLFESLNAQNQLSMCRQAMENQDVLRFSIMVGVIPLDLRTQLAWAAYDADDLEFFSLSVRRLPARQRQSLLQQAYQDGRTAFFDLLKNS